MNFETLKKSNGQEVFLPCEDVRYGFKRKKKNRLQKKKKKSSAIKGTIINNSKIKGKL